MADTKISLLPPGTLTPASIMPVVTGGDTKRVTFQQVLDAVGVIQGPKGDPGADGAPGQPGADGKDGADGQSITVFQSQTAPTANSVGDLWVQEVSPGVSKLYIWSGTDWDSLAGTGGGSDIHIVSPTEPPPGTELGAIWIDPSAEDRYPAPPVSEQTDGQVIGLSADGQLFHQPYIVGGIPVTVGGKEYLIALIDR